MLPTKADVVIVGAGPTGLALAATLAKSGVDFVLLDKLSEGANTSRAAVVHARTLEVLETLDVTDRLRAEGLVVPKFTVRDRDRALLTIRFDRLPTRYPYTLMIPQDRTEAILLGRLSELGGQVHRPYTLTDLRQDGTGAVVTVKADGNGPPQTIQARYVIGADGMHSTVRERAGIGFVGGSYEEAFVLADVRMTWALGRDEVMLYFSPEGVMVVAPLPGGHSGSWRPSTRRRRTRRRPTSSGCSIRAVLRRRRPGWWSFRGARASGCTTASPTPSAPAACCSPATPPTCTARRAG